MKSRDVPLRLRLGFSGSGAFFPFFPFFAFFSSSSSFAMVASVPDDAWGRCHRFRDLETLLGDQLFACSWTYSLSSMSEQLGLAGWHGEREDP